MRVAARAALRAWTVLVVVLLLAVVVRLPWDGDLGMHAATVERLRHDLFEPGDPLVVSDAPSPYYSPWTFFLGCVARISGLSVFVVLRIGALIGLALLVTGIWRYARTLSAHRMAGPLAVLCVLFLWGPCAFEWSGFLGLNSLALTVAYPSTFALGLSFHFWAWLTKAVRDKAGWGEFLGLGLLWAVILLSHQFTGVVASLGALGVVAGSRGPVPREVWWRLGAGLALGSAVVAVWPYYDFFALFGVSGLEAIHRPLYRAMLPHYGLALLGVLALGLRLRRDRRDPLVVFFALGALMVAAGGLTGHYSWGRALPAALIPAQLAAALEACRLRPRSAYPAMLGAALLAGTWAQAGTLGYVTGRGALPAPVAARYRPPWPGYHWITPWVRYGDVILARTTPSRQLPAYGAYTVAPGYPDIFLADEQRRQTAVNRYFARDTCTGERRAILREYGVRWVLGAAGEKGSLVREVARGPGGLVLYEVVG